MVKEFRERADSDSHAEFQKWRREHPAGFFLNCRTDSVVMLHRCRCIHVGNMEHARGEWADLAKHLKACDDDRGKLLSWAKDNGYTAEKCADCKP